VTGKNSIETSLAGRVTIDAERAAAALEVMSRFAADPRWLVYLPPTMAPVATSKRRDHLEHPDEAFGYFRNAGVTQVVCEEKHMGSRAVVIMARTSDAAQRRFGITNSTGNDAAGVVVARTGRPFFSDPSLSAALLERLRSTVDAAGWWETLGSDWLVLDTELLPWSAKAGELLRRQYAPTGAAATAMLGTVGSLVAAAQARAATGTDPATAVALTALTELGERSAARAEHVANYVQAYGRYVWDVDGLAGIEIAPFQILAAEGEVLARRSHRWHLDQIDALVEHGAGFIRRTKRCSVDLADAEQVAAATDWWTALTTQGGEGMVVKPVDPLVQGEKGFVLPGLKCRGQEYLRIVYGPEYLEPENLERLRSRSLGRKSSLARQETALRIEALDRFVANGHLHQVHECVFGVLALESEPVDPRL